VVLGGTSLMGGKFSIAGTVVGVLIIQTLESSILFLGVSPAQSPVFFALVVVVVVIIQSPALHRLVRRFARSLGPSSINDPDVETAR
jgi:simple sugar transport system permease protein